jgi:D-alanyl-D-alanine carboxypeptidase (penicillin-binding protein 5/6)
VAAEAAMLVDLSTDEVLFAKDANSPRAPASLTKMVTALVVMDVYELDQTVEVSVEAANTRASSIDLQAGQAFSVDDLLWMTLIKSSNDAAAALAHHHPLGYSHFIGLMNQKARSLGAFTSRFRNPHGLDEDGHVSTVRDMATFARQLLAEPYLARIVRTRQLTMPWPDGTQKIFVNSNKLLARYQGAVGVKTGYTNRAGNCLAAAADTPSGRMLTIVFRSPDHYGDTAALMDFAKALRLAPTAQGDRGEPADPGGIVLPDPGGVVLPDPPPAPAVPLNLASAPARTVVDPSGYRWAAFMALLGAAMLLTLYRPRRAHPLQEAAQFHAWMDPLVPTERRNG